MLLHQSDKAVKQMPAVLRSRCALRVILNAEGSVFFTCDSFYSPIQQITVCHTERCARQTLLIDCIREVLGCDLYFSGQQIFHRMQLSARAYHRLIKVARTIADLEESETIESRHITEASCYRLADGKYWRRDRE